MKQIKKTVAFLLFAVTLLFTSSCSKENDSNSKIIGRWIITDHNCYIYAGDGSLVSSWGNNSIYTDDIGEIYEFSTNGSVLINNTLIGTYTIHDKIVSICHSNSSRIDNLSIEKLTNKTMSLKEEIDNYEYELRDENNNFIGVFYDGVWKETIEFEKLGS